MQPLIPKLGIEHKRDRFHRDSFSFPNGSRILALTDKEEACRSYTAQLLVVDEGARCTLTPGKEGRDNGEKVSAGH